MTTFNQLLSDVYTLTNRPDLVSETTLAVKAATLKAHRSDFYSKDIYETGISFPNLAFRQSLDYVDLIPNLRSFKYVRIVNSSTDDLGCPIEFITPDDVLDSYGQNKTNIAYVAGRSLEMRAAVAFQYALVGAYVLPIVTADIHYTSWVADQFPYAIVYEAARVVFRTIGQMEESNSYAQLVKEEYDILGRTALSDHGY